MPTWNLYVDGKIPADVKNPVTGDDEYSKLAAWIAQVSGAENTWCFMRPDHVKHFINFASEEWLYIVVRETGKDSVGWLADGYLCPRRTDEIQARALSESKIKEEQTKFENLKAALTQADFSNASADFKNNKYTSSETLQQLFDDNGEVAQAFTSALTKQLGGKKADGLIGWWGKMTVDDNSKVQAVDVPLGVISVLDPGNNSWEGCTTRWPSDSFTRDYQLEKIEFISAVATEQTVDDEPVFIQTIPQVNETASLGTKLHELLLSLTLPRMKQNGKTRVDDHYALLIQRAPQNLYRMKNVPGLIDSLNQQLSAANAPAGKRSTSRAIPQLTLTETTGSDDPASEKLLLIAPDFSTSTENPAVNIHVLTGDNNETVFKELLNDEKKIAGDLLQKQVDILLAATNVQKEKSSIEGVKSAFLKPMGGITGNYETERLKFLKIEAEAWWKLHNLTSLYALKQRIAQLPTELQKRTEFTQFTNAGNFTTLVNKVSQNDSTWWNYASTAKGKQESLSTAVAKASKNRKAAIEFLASSDCNLLKRDGSLYPLNDTKIPDKPTCEGYLGPLAQATYDKIKKLIPAYICTGILPVSKVPTSGNPKTVNGGTLTLKPPVGNQNQTLIFYKPPSNSPYKAYHISIGVNLNANGSATVSSAHVSPETWTGDQQKKPRYWFSIKQYLPINNQDQSAWIESAPAVYINPYKNSDQKNPSGDTSSYNNPNFVKEAKDFVKDNANILNCTFGQVTS